MEEEIKNGIEAAGREAPAPLDSLNLKEAIREYFNIPPCPLSSYSPLALAHLGDCVYELIIRTILLERGNARASRLHVMSVQYVSARAQAALIRRISTLLTKEEAGIYNRGRNARPKSVPKNASLSDYHAATGFESLMGYLYLQGRMERILFLIKAGIEESLIYE